METPHAPLTDPIAPAVAEGENRRKFGRVMVEGLACSWGRIIDLSSGGAKVRMNLRCPPVGQLIHTTMPTPQGELAVAARVVWTKRVGLLAWEVGCEFVALDPASQRLLMETAAAKAVERPRDVA